MLVHVRSLAARVKKKVEMTSIGQPPNVCASSKICTRRGSPLNVAFWKCRDFRPKNGKPYRRKLLVNKRLMLILRTDPEFNEMAKGEMYQYIDAIRSESANIAEGEAQPPENQHLRETKHVSIYNKYIETEIDPSYSTTKEALAKKHYIENECWIIRF